MFRSCPVALSLALSILPGSAFADVRFVGSWTQTSSSAGDCPTCRLTIREDDHVLRVEANNGWSAAVAPVLVPDADLALGQGRFGAGGGAYANQQFYLAIRVVNNGLEAELAPSVDGVVKNLIVMKFTRAE